eukprot:m.187176 g.187176  ORF g.187176 m.187176 type:complete len:1351 (-) comp18154_c0_seq1:40-4092(-)
MQGASAAAVAMLLMAACVASATAAVSVTKRPRQTFVIPAKVAEVDGVDENLIVTAIQPAVDVQVKRTKFGALRREFDVTTTESETIMRTASEQIGLQQEVIDSLEVELDEMTADLQEQQQTARRAQRAANEATAARRQIRETQRTLDRAVTEATVTYETSLGELANARRAIGNAELELSLAELRAANKEDQFRGELGVGGNEAIIQADVEALGDQYLALLIRVQQANQAASSFNNQGDAFEQQAEEIEIALATVQEESQELVDNRDRILNAVSKAQDKAADAAEDTAAALAAQGRAGVELGDAQVQSNKAEARVIALEQLLSEQQAAVSRNKAAITTYSKFFNEFKAKAIEATTRVTQLREEFDIKHRDTQTDPKSSSQARDQLKPDVSIDKVSELAEMYLKKSEEAGHALNTAEQAMKDAEAHVANLLRDIKTAERQQEDRVEALQDALEVANEAGKTLRDKQDKQGQALGAVGQSRAGLEQSVKAISQSRAQVAALESDLAIALAQRDVARTRSSIKTAEAAKYQREADRVLERQREVQALTDTGAAAAETSANIDLVKEINSIQKSLVALRDLVAEKEAAVQSSLAALADAQLQAAGVAVGLTIARREEQRLVQQAEFATEDAGQIEGVFQQIDESIAALRKAQRSYRKASEDAAGAFETQVDKHFAAIKRYDASSDLADGLRVQAQAQQVAVVAAAVGRESTIAMIEGTRQQRQAFVQSIRTLENQLEGSEEEIDSQKSEARKLRGRATAIKVDDELAELARVEASVRQQVTIAEDAQATERQQSRLATIALSESDAFQESLANAEEQLSDLVVELRDVTFEIERKSTVREVDTSEQEDFAAELAADAEEKGALALEQKERKDLAVRSANTIGVAVAEQSAQLDSLVTQFSRAVLSQAAAQSKLSNEVAAAQDLEKRIQSTEAKLEAFEQAIDRPASSSSPKKAIGGNTAAAAQVQVPVLRELLVSLRTSYASRIAEASRIREELTGLDKAIGSLRKDVDELTRRLESTRNEQANRLELAGREQLRYNALFTEFSAAQSRAAAALAVATRPNAETPDVSVEREKLAQLEVAVLQAQETVEELSEKLQEAQSRAAIALQRAQAAGSSLKEATERLSVLDARAFLLRTDIEARQGQQAALNRCALLLDAIVSNLEKAVGRIELLIESFRQESQALATQLETLNAEAARFDDDLLTSRAKLFDLIQLANEADERALISFKQARQAFKNVQAARLVSLRLMAKADGHAAVARSLLSQRISILARTASPLLGDKSFVISAIAPATINEAALASSSNSNSANIGLVVGVAISGTVLLGMIVALVVMRKRSESIRVPITLEFEQTASRTLSHA